MNAARRIALLTLAGVSLLACSSGPASSSKKATTTTTSHVQADVAEAVRQGLLAEGVPGSNFVVSAAVSRVDASWASFTVRPTADAKASFQGGYGFAHRDGDTWKVEAQGSALVGCNQNSGFGMIAVPPAVIAAAGYHCP